jgi:transcriptional regulator with GAF, ATPase, and Fis domain
METTVARSPDESCRALDRLIVELSLAMIRARADDVTTVVEHALQSIGEALDVDGATFAELDDAGSIRSTLHWIAPIQDPSAGDGETASLDAVIRSLRISDEPIVLERMPDDLLAGEMASVDRGVQPTPLKSAAFFPVSLSTAFTGVLAIGALRDYRAWAESVLERLRRLAEILSSAWYRHAQERAIHASDDSPTADSPAADQLPADQPLRRQLTMIRAHAAVPGFEDIVGDSPSLRGALAQLQEVASGDTTVLLLGETGTGKELFAKALHSRSERRHFPLVSVNCAALPPTLIESELFGHERGAFTGAITHRQGRFELAHRGTLFLDEIGDLPLDLQAKLLRVLQEGEFERLGTSHTRRVDVRIVAATHRDLGQEVADGMFRDDLYYRLNVFPIRLPPLRERRKDIPALVWFVIQKRQRGMHRWIKHVPQEVMDALQQHSWPGNVRELENVIERALIHSTGDTLVLLEDDIQAVSDAPGPDAGTLDAVERAHIEEILRECDGRINGIGNAAERLGLHPNTLRFRMKKLGITRPRRPIALKRTAAGRLR